MLEMVGIKFTLLDVEVDEDRHFAEIRVNMSPACRRKKRKLPPAKSQRHSRRGGHDSLYGWKIMNKPKDAEDAGRMLTC